MEQKVCPYCNQIFYSNFNLHRHKLRFHKTLMEFSQEDHKINEEESDTGSQDSNEAETNVSESEMSDAGDEQNYWQVLINETFMEMDIHKEIKNPKEIL